MQKQKVGLAGAIRLKLVLPLAQASLIVEEVEFNYTCCKATTKSAVLLNTCEDTTSDP